MPSQPTKPLGKLARVTALVLPILLVYALTAGLVMGLAAAINGDPLFSSTNLTVGLLGGIASWLIVTVFHANHETIEIPFGGRQSFLHRLQAELERLGYEVQVQPNGQVVGRPGFSSWLFGGNVVAELTVHSATVSGPKLFLEMLRNRVRVDRVMERTQQSLQQARLRQGQQLWRRVQIDLRVNPDQWDDIQEQLIEALRAEGANVVCEVSLLAQSDDGILDFIVEEEIRKWLKGQGIRAEILKEAQSAGESRQTERT